MLNHQSQVPSRVTLLTRPLTSSASVVWSSRFHPSSSMLALVGAVSCSRVNTREPSAPITGTSFGASSGSTHPLPRSCALLAQLLKPCPGSGSQYGLTATPTAAAAADCCCAQTPSSP